MTQTNYAYPGTTHNGLYLIHDSAWAVREDKDNDNDSLVDLTDAITERLAKAEALTRLLQDGREQLPDGSLSDAAWAIADLIHEARELYDRQWQQVKHYERNKR